MGKRTTLSEEDAACESHFVSTHTRNDEGRYIVRLPFKEKPTLGNSRLAAERMLTNLQRRFQREPEFHQLYNAFLEEYLQLGHMERVRNGPEEDVFYMPHHGVLRASSTTTKLRVVFNGSQKADSGTSINDHLHAGPKVQTDLIDVILRWRFHRCVFAADVEKMYRQVLVHPLDRDFQRILWTDNPQKPAEAFRLCTVTYGLACAPFLAIRVLQQLAIDEGPRFPLAADALQNNFYVDDCLSGASTIEETQEKVSRIDKLLSAGGFHLQKWASNCDDVLIDIETSRRQNIAKSFEEDTMLRALRISWSPISNSFVLTAHQDMITPTTSLTKRTVLSMVAKLFDPLGWLSPVVIVAKIFLQSMWRRPLSWDDKLPADLTAEWSTFSQNLKSTVFFSIPRWIGTTPSSELEVHGFADASKDALAAVVYLRVLEENFEASTFLLTSKTRVAPLKSVTIARLELSAAVLLAQLVQRCQSSLHLQDVPVHLWTDFSVALTWISGHPSRWKDFVRNSHIHPGDSSYSSMASRSRRPKPG